MLLKKPLNASSAEEACIVTPKEIKLPGTEKIVALEDGKQNCAPEGTKVQLPMLGITRERDDSRTSEKLLQRSYDRKNRMIETFGMRDSDMFSGKLCSSQTGVFYERDACRSVKMISALTFSLSSPSMQCCSNVSSIEAPGLRPCQL